MFFRRIALYVAFLTIWPLQAYAAEITREGADHLRVIFEQLIEDQKLTYNAGSARLIYDGKVVVEPSQSYYAITLPFFKTETPDGNRIDVGMVSINASPDEKNPKQWVMSFALPTPMTVYDEKNQPVFNINLGPQRARGVFDEDLKSLIKLDALYTNIAAQAADPNIFSLLIPETAIRYDFTQGSETGLLSGTGFITSKNIAFQADSGKGNGKIGEFRADFSLDKYNLAEFNKSRQRIAALTQGLSTQSIDSKAHAKTLNELLNNFYSSFGEGAKADYMIRNAEFNGPAKDAGSPPYKLKIDSFLFGGNFGGFTSGKGRFGLHFGFDGLNTSGKELQTDIVPTQARIAFDVQNIPVKELTTIGQNALMGSMENPEMAQMALMSTILKIPALLSQAGTFGVMENNYVAGKDYRFDVNGKIQADINAVTNFTADLKGKFAGLDTLIEKVQRLSITGGDDAEYYTQLLQQLKMLQSAGKKEEGSAVYTYDFVVTPQGQTLMNGQQFQTKTAPTP